MEKIILGMLDFFSWLFRAMQVDYPQLRAIIAIKLTMDNRRQIVAFKQKSNNETNNAFLTTVLFYAFFGLFIAFVLFGIPHMIVALIIFFSYIMVMLSMTIITDFSSTLLDTSDNTIILPRPVTSRTLFVARIVHILIYLSLLTAGLALIPSVVMLIKYGWVMFVLFLVGVCLSVLVALSFTNGLYLLVMRFASEEKLKNVINYFQIVMAVTIMGGYQVLPRVLGRFDLETYEFDIQWWAYFTPPVWLAGALEAVHERNFDTPHLILIGLALTLPVLVFLVINKYLTPVFSRKLGAISTASEPVVTRTVQQQGKNFASKIADWLTRNLQERAAFEFVYKTLARDRKIKLKVYPTFGYVFIFGLIFIMRSREDFLVTFQNLHNTEYHLMLIYLTFMILQVALFEIPYSDDFKASWIYAAAPLTKPGEILSGMLKAMFVRLFIPGYLAIAIIVMYIWGVNSIGDIVFGLLNNFLMLLVLALIGKKMLPLSLQPSLRNQAGTFARSMIMLFMLALLGFTHYFLSKFPIVIWAMVPVQGVAIYLLLRYYRNISWEEFTL
jgi:ABC-2 type transport system permease protein